MKRSYIFMISVFLFSIMLFSLFGCNTTTDDEANECSEDTDCPQKGDCFNDYCNNGKCISDPIDQCCGNNMCEAEENLCTCPKDCGSCASQTTGSKYLTYYCNEENECVFRLDESKVEEKAITSSTIKSTAASYIIESDFNQPFNVGSDLFNIKITQTDEKENLKNIVFTKFEMTGINEENQKVTIGSKEVSRPIWGVNDIVEESIIISQAQEEGVIKSLTLTVYYTYDQEVKNELVEKKGSFNYVYKKMDFEYISPDTEIECPPEDEWDDGNPGTRDECSAATNFFVMHTPIPNVCGNYNCEGEENKCNCPTDCGACFGDVGDYTEWHCGADEVCKVGVKRDFESEHSTFFMEKNFKKFTITHKISYDDPFDMNASDFKVIFEISDLVEEDISEVEIGYIRLLSSDKMLYEINLEKDWDENDDPPIKLSFYPYFLESPDHEEKIGGIKLKVWYEAKDYNNTVVDSGDYTLNIGTITFLFPDNIHRTETEDE